MGFHLQVAYVEKRTMFSEVTNENFDLFLSLIN